MARKSELIGHEHAEVAVVFFQILLKSKVKVLKPFDFPFAEDNFLADIIQLALPFDLISDSDAMAALQSLGLLALQVKAMLEMIRLSLYLSEVLLKHFHLAFAKVEFLLLAVDGLGTLNYEIGYLL